MKRLLLLAMIAILIAGCAKVDVKVPDYRKYYDSSETVDPGSDQPSQDQNEGDDDDDNDDQSLILPAAGQGVLLSPAENAEAEGLTGEVLDLYRKGQYAQAETKLRKLLQKEPDLPGHWYNLACLQALQGHTNQALGSLQTAADKGYAEYRQLLKDDDLKSVRKTEKFKAIAKRVGDQARQAARAERKRQGERTKLFRNMMAAFRGSKFTEARDLAKKIVAMAPGDSISWYNLACAESRLGNTDEAVKALRSAIENGYFSFRHMEQDPDLANIRNTDAYKGILVQSKQLIRSQAEDVLKQLKSELGDDYLFEIDHEQKLLFATNIDRRMLDELRSYLSAYAKVQRQTLFEHDFEQYVTVILPREWKLRGVGGLYNPSRRTLTARSLGMVMTHEFTHALHFGDQEGLDQHHPIWLTEGLATLFESSKIIDGQVVPQPNYRLLLLQNRAKRKKLIGLERLTAWSHKDFMRRAAMAYAQSRYLLFYLHSQDKLKAFYDAYAEGYENDSGGSKALEKVLGKKLDAIEEDFRKWVIAQKAPPLRLRPNQAYIGIRMQQVKDGLKIVRAVPGSGAAAAGLKPGDVVVKVDDDRVVDSSDLLSIVAASDVGDKLTLEIRRDGKYQTVEVTLTAMPERIPR